MSSIRLSQKRDDAHRLLANFFSGSAESFISVGSFRLNDAPPNSLAGTLPEKFTHNDVTACADQRPLTTKRSAIGGA
jgi:hypothetical protein